LYLPIQKFFIIPAAVAHLGKDYGQLVHVGPLPRSWRDVWQTLTDANHDISTDPWFKDFDAVAR
jgi:hypothetical protein